MVISGKAQTESFVCTWKSRVSMCFAIDIVSDSLFWRSALGRPDDSCGARVVPTREELEAAVRPVRRLWMSVTPWQVQLRWWLCELAPDAELVPNPAEVESFDWLTLAQMAELPELLASNRHFLRALAQEEIELAI